MAQRKRSHRVSLRLDDGGLAQLQENMRTAGIENREAYLRKMVLEGLVVQLDTTCLRELSVQYRKAGVLMERFVQLALSKGTIYPNDLLALEERFLQIGEMTEGILGNVQKVEKFSHLILDKYSQSC